jgi:hypothetical protein
MSSGRAASAVSSLRAKQDVVRLLFSGATKTKGPVALCDPFSYTYKNLRTAYLQKLHELHPDKSQHCTGKSTKALFVELQTAWNAYEQYNKSYRHDASTADRLEGDFTMFGVGCSFSDSEREKDLRAVIMDQASRGWFSAGQLQDKGAECVSEPANETTTMMSPSLFTCMEGEDHVASTENVDQSCLKSVGEHQASAASARSWLVSDLSPGRPRQQSRALAMNGLDTKNSRSVSTRRPFSTSLSTLSGVLHSLSEHKIDIDEAEDMIAQLSIDGSRNNQDISNEQLLHSFADLDHGRTSRTGFPEAVFAQGKTPQQVAIILDDMARHVNEIAARQVDQDSTSGHPDRTDPEQDRTSAAFAAILATR